MSEVGPILPWHLAPLLVSRPNEAPQLGLWLAPGPSPEEFYLVMARDTGVALPVQQRQVTPDGGTHHLEPAHL